MWTCIAGCWALSCVPPLILCRLDTMNEETYSDGYITITVVLALFSLVWMVIGSILFLTADICADGDFYSEFEELQVLALTLLVFDYVVSIISISRLLIAWYSK